MKKYYVNYGEFANQYKLAYSESDIEDQWAKDNGFERITRKEAYKLVEEENDRRKYNPMFSGFAMNTITPIKDYFMLIPDDMRILESSME